MQDELDIETTTKQVTHPPVALTPPGPPPLPTRRSSTNTSEDIEITTSLPTMPPPPPLRAKYFYTRGDEQCGPVSSAELKSLALAGSLLPTDQIWKEGMIEWVPASSAKELFPTAAPATTPRPPPLRRVSSNPSLDNLDLESTIPRAKASPPTSIIGSSAPREPSTSQATETLAIGNTLDGKYVVTKVLGKGGIGIVYKAAERDTGVEFAIKVLSPELFNDANARADMKKEVANAQRLTHQNLLKINYLADTGPITYVVMEYIDGENLEEYRVRKGGKITLPEFRQIAPQIMGALDYLHEKGVVHCDVKPQNIMITPSGEIKLTDYGIARTIKEQLARESMSQISAGTLAYMAPEQIRGSEVIDRRADIYALGIMFHRLLVGKFPFEGIDRQAVIAWHIDGSHLISDLGSPHVNHLVQKSVAVDPNDRFTTCAELFRELSADSSLIDARPTVAPSKREDILWLLSALRKFITTRPQDITKLNVLPKSWGKVVRTEQGYDFAAPPQGVASVFKGLASIYGLDGALGGQSLLDPLDEIMNRIDRDRIQGLQLDPQVRTGMESVIEHAKRAVASFESQGWIKRSTDVKGKGHHAYCDRVVALLSQSLSV
jgi:serine/threonine protein kinase